MKWNYLLSSLCAKQRHAFIFNQNQYFTFVLLKYINVLIFWSQIYSTQNNYVFIFFIKYIVEMKQTLTRHIQCISYLLSIKKETTHKIKLCSPLNRMFWNHSGKWNYSPPLLYVGKWLVFVCVCLYIPVASLQRKIMWFTI